MVSTQVRGRYVKQIDEHGAKMLIVFYKMPPLLLVGTSSRSNFVLDLRLLKLDSPIRATRCGNDPSGPSKATIRTLKTIKQRQETPLKQVSNS